MSRLFVVEPSSGGWRVRFQEDRLEFASGARAEATARRLAQEHAAAGGRAEVRVVLRNGDLAGVSHY